MNSLPRYIERESHEKILLVDISSIDNKRFFPALNALGYTSIWLTQTEINTTRILHDCREKFYNIWLMIVYAQKDHGQEDIKKVNSAQKNLYSDTAVDLPILAIIGSSKSNKYLLYDLGAFDYISSPLIPAGLIFRITCGAETLLQTTVVSIVQVDDQVGYRNSNNF